MYQVQFAAGTSSSPSNWTNAGSTITLSVTTDYWVSVRHTGREAWVGRTAVYKIVAINDPVSTALTDNSCDATLEITGD